MSSWTFLFERLSKVTHEDINLREAEGKGGFKKEY